MTRPCLFRRFFESSRMTNQRSPVLLITFWMFVSAAGFACLMALARHLNDTGMHVLVLSFWRNLFAVGVFVPWMIKLGRTALQSRRHPEFFLRGIVFVSSSLTLLWAATIMPIAEVTAITFTAPLFSTILAVLIMKEAIRWRRVAALMVGLAGVLLMLRPGVEAIQLGAVLAIVSAFLFGFIVIMGKRLNTTESPEIVIMMLSFWSLPISAIPAAFFWQVPSGDQWWYLLALGVAANLNMYGIQRALSLGDVGLTQVFDFVRLPLTFIIAYFAFDETLDVWFWLGGVIISAAAVYTTRRESAQSAG